MYISDVGGNLGNSVEELNRGSAGANYGWPFCEGGCDTPGMTNPIFSYPHNNRDAAIIVGPVYRATQFPQGYRGSLFYADYAQHWIRRLTFDANGNVSGGSNFQPADGALYGPYGNIVDLKVGPEGSLYYVDIALDNNGNRLGPGSVRRISFTAGNQAPVINQTSANPTSGTGQSLTTTFTASASDPENDALTYSWNFGDGASGTGATTSHTYTQQGTYSARVTVGDGTNQTISEALIITVGSPPVPRIDTPNNGLVFQAGDTIAYSGSATDPDGTLTAANYSWTVLFHHDNHVHPAQGPTSGATSGTLEIPTTGMIFRARRGSKLCCMLPTRMAWSAQRRRRFTRVKLT